MYILDTDHLSLIQRNGLDGRRIRRRLAAIEEDQAAVTIITYEEQVRGRLKTLSAAREVNDRVSAYRLLQRLAVDYKDITLIAFDHSSSLEYQRLRKAYPRLGSMDLRIAAITLANDAVLLTRNRSDFERIENIQVEDWSVG